MKQLLLKYESLGITRNVHLIPEVAQDHLRKELLNIDSQLKELNLENPCSNSSDFCLFCGRVTSKIAYHALAER